MSRIIARTHRSRQDQRLSGVFQGVNQPGGNGAEQLAIAPCHGPGRGAAGLLAQRCSPAPEDQCERNPGFCRRFPQFRSVRVL